MLLALLAIALGYGIKKLVRRTDGVGILIYVIFGIIILVVGVFLTNPKTAGLCAAGYFVGVFSANKI